MNRRMMSCLLLAAATTAAYGPVIGFDFVDLDDKTYVTDVPQVKGG